MKNWWEMAIFRILKKVISGKWSQNTTFVISKSNQNKLVIGWRWRVRREAVVLRNWADCLAKKRRLKRIEIDFETNFIMENSISIGTKEFASTHPTSERERQQLRLSTCPFGWGDRPTTNQQRPRQRRTRHQRERRRCALRFISWPPTTWKICLAVPSTASRAFLISLPNRRLIPWVPLFLRYQLIRDFVIV